MLDFCGGGMFLMKMYGNIFFESLKVATCGKNTMNRDNQIINPKFKWYKMYQIEEHDVLASLPEIDHH